MKTKILIIVILLGTYLGAFAQQLPYFNHVYLNQALINPSMNGMGTHSEIMLIQRNNLIGFPESPQSFLLNIQSPLSEKTGIGFSVYRESLGITDKNAGYFSYAYRLKFQEDHNLNFGLSLGFFQFAMNPDMTVVGDPRDPVLVNKSFKSSTIDGSIGLTYINRNFRAGISMMQVFARQANLSDDVNYKLEQNYVGMFQYSLKFSEAGNFTLTPIIITRYAKSILPQDVILSMNFREQFWLNPSYNSAGAVGLSAAALLNSKLKLGYSYETIVREPVSGNQRGGHEIMFSYQFRSSSKEFESQKKDIDALYEQLNALKKNQEERDRIQDKRIDQLKEEADNEKVKTNQRLDSLQSEIKNTSDELEKLKKELIKAGVIKEFSVDEYDNAQAGYYIVIASVKNTRYNPEAMKQEYLSKGYKVVYNKVRGWHYVYTVRLDDFSEALRELKKTRSDLEKTAWIHILK